MNQLIKGLYIDLFNRLEKMTLHLERLSMTSPVAGGFQKTAIFSMHELKKKIAAVIKSGILTETLFTRNAIISYNSLNNEFIDIELFLFLPISKYSLDAEGYFEKVVQKIYFEIQCTQSVPFISTISNSESYYWAYSKYKMIALPQGEEKYLLNLSDLYHEIGHLIYVQSEQFLVNDHLAIMKTYFEEKRSTFKGKKKTTKQFEKIQEAIDFWDNYWSEELACDLIGTFLVGPAYAWSHMKICTTSSGINALFSYNKMIKEHPPDEIRMRAILQMLDQIDQNEEAAKIREIWGHFLQITRNTKPSDYELFFAQGLIDSIVKNVFEGCTNIALRSYPDQVKNTTRPVSEVINEAWTKIRQDPEGFNKWESEQIANLQSLSFLY